MVIVETMTPQRIAEILEFPMVYDEDCPELTDEQRARLKPKYPHGLKTHETPVDRMKTA